MTWYQRILRQPTLITALVVAVLAALPAFGVDLTNAQHVAILGLVAAVIAILSLFVTPSSEVIAQQKPGGAVTATAKAEKRWGIPVGRTVHVNPATRRHAA